MFVDWGDNSSETITSYTSNTHTYTSAGTYDVKITGTCSRWSFNAVTTSKNKVTAVLNWGRVGFTTLTAAFDGCSNLASIAPFMPNTSDAYSWTFRNTALQSIPENLFSNSVSSYGVSGCFYNCASLTSIPAGLFDNCINAENFNLCFYNCVSLSSIPAGLFKKNTKAKNFNTAFGWTSIASIPSGLFDNNTLVTTFEGCFNNCASLAAIPSGLFDNNTAVTNFVSCFSGCASLSGASGELWLNPSGAGNYTLTSPDYDSGVPNGENCYYNCTGLSDYADIPTYWK
ncbi:MAG: leucine-rich repeat protein, partial [Victivallaceae bacterium]|nr:leucine-rich repeat protein [Victivallaceae bacterium]